MNALASGLDYGARLLVEFLINPFMVSGLGDYVYGLWRILWRVSNYVVTLTGRSAQALKTVVANQQASHDYARKKRDLGASLAVWLLTLPLVAAGGAALSWIVPALLRVPPEHVFAARLATAILAANVIVMAVADVPRAVLQGENLGYKRMGLSSVVVLLGGGLMVGGVKLGLGLVGVSLAAMATTILNGLMFVRVVRREVPWFGVVIPLRADVLGFARISGWFTLWRLVLQVMATSDVVILGMLGSVDSVTVYSLTKYVPEAVIGLIAMFVFGAVPGLGGIIGSEHHEKAARVRAEMQTFTWFVATVVGATILLWNRSFLALWVGAKYDAGALATLLIVVMTTQFVLIRNDANIIDLTLRLGEKTLIGLLSAGLSVLAAAVFVGPLKLGIAGLCLGYIAGRTVMSVAYPWRIGRAFHQPFAAQLRALLRPGLTSAVLFTACLALGQSWNARSWPALVAAVAGSVVVVAATVLGVGLSRAQRKPLLKRMQKVAELLRATASRDRVAR